MGIRAQALSWTLAFIFLPLCAAYAPVSMLPHALQMVAWCFPATYAFEAMRLVVIEGRADWSLVWTGAAASAVFLVIGIICVSLAFERARRLGFDHLE
jgi:ABC-2 type transport system permease protein